MTQATDTLLDGLNDRQLEAVTQTHTKSTLVIAGAGSGKTGVLTRRAAYLIQRKKVNPGNMMIVTFTNKAAREMKKRIEDFAGPTEASKITMGTFHSIAVKMLRRHGASVNVSPRFTIYDTDDQKQLVRQALQTYGLATDANNVRMALGKISDLKNKLVTPQGYFNILARGPKQDPAEQLIQKVYASYQALLDKHKALDFDDLIMKTVQMLDQDTDVRKYYQDRYKWLMVDEYQDTNPAQYKMINLIAGKNNVFAVGDDAQSIYGFRGSDIQIILNFEEDYPGCHIVKLEQNYRSTKTIVKAGNALIKHNTNQKEKTLFTDNSGGSKIKLVELPTGAAEAQYVVNEIQNLIKFSSYGAGDIAVLYRLNFLSQEVERELNKVRIPYNVVGGVSFYERMEIKDMIAYLRVIMNPHDNIAMKRVLANAPGIGKTTVTAIEELAESVGASLAVATKSLIPARKATATAIEVLRETLNELHRCYQLGKAITDTPVSDMLEIILRKTQYRQALVNIGDEEAMGRVENIDELCKVAAIYEQDIQDADLEGFLENAALASARDDAALDQQVSLMSIHASKGLEFPVVFLVGWEENVFPSRRAVTPEDIAEERRLAYVGLTRAEHEAYVTCAKSRSIYRQVEFNKPSRFLAEIPKETVVRL